MTFSHELASSPEGGNSVVRGANLDQITEEDAQVESKDQSQPGGASDDDIAKKEYRKKIIDEAKRLLASGDESATALLTSTKSPLPEIDRYLKESIDLDSRR